jgi:C4-dicarboxylate-specific signal transduction histidine kinase
MITTALVSFINVLVRTRLIKKVNDRHDHMERVIDQFPVATIHLEHGRAIINKSMQSLIGVKETNYSSISEVLRECFQETENNEKILQLQNELNVRGSITPTQLTISSRSKGHRNVEVTAYKDDMSEIWTMRDETEKLAAQANMTYSAKMASLGEMAGGIAHEINNPLTIIKCTIEILAKKICDGSVTPQEAQTMATRVGKTVNRIATIVTGLQKFSRSDENQAMMHYDFNEILEDALDLCRERLRAASVKLDCRIPETPILINCQPIEISQIMINLINNARDAVASQEEKWISVTALEQHDTIQIRVSNSGKRIPEKIAAKIMQPFFTTKEVGEGTGLGLSISKGIAEQHGGSLTLDQSFCHTSFVLTLPKVDQLSKTA